MKSCFTKSCENFMSGWDDYFQICDLCYKELRSCTNNDIDLSARLKAESKYPIIKQVKEWQRIKELNKFYGN